MTEHSTEKAGLSEQRTYRVKEVPTWHGQQDTPRSAMDRARSAATAATAPPNTPATTTSAQATRLAETVDPRHIGWCAGGGRGATPDGACPVCGYVGKVSRHGVVPHHRDRRHTSLASAIGGASCNCSCNCSGITHHWASCAYWPESTSGEAS